MKIVLQRVTSASVRVDGELCGSIDTGYLLLFGAGHEDTEEDCRRLADKIINLRIFSDENGKINLSRSGRRKDTRRTTVHPLCRLPQGKQTEFHSGCPSTES